MIRGLYTAASGMMTEKIKQETMANNMSNLSTSGYKRDQSVVSSFPHMLLSSQERSAGFMRLPALGSINLGALVEENITQHSQGQLKQTDSPLDFGLEGEGFFAVMTPDGVRYTRSGHFLRDSQGNLVTDQGHRVLGEGEEPLVIPGEDIQVDGEGNITSRDQQVGRMLLAEFENPETLRKEGSNLFNVTEGTQLVNQEGLNTTLHQGFLEGANVDLAQEISQAMIALRAYEMNQRVIQTQDELLSKCANEVGSLR